MYRQATAIRNVDRDLFMWPCEPVLGPERRRGYVSRKIEEVLAAEYTLAAIDLAAFLVSGFGMSVRRIMSGAGSTAGVAAFIAPLQPDLAWRAWEVLKREWLKTGLYRQ
jgi:hypothetical protein